MLLFLLNRLYQQNLLHRKPILDCLDSLLSTRMSLLDLETPKTTPTTASRVHAPISFEILSPVLMFYNDSHWGGGFDFLTPSRNAQGRLFYPRQGTQVGLQNHAVSALIRLTQCSSYPTDADTSFSDQLHSCIEARLLSLDASPSDFCIGSILLVSACQVFGNLTIIKTVALLKRFQECKSKDAVRQRALGNVCVNVLLDLALSLDLDPLIGYLEQLKVQRVDAREWSPGIERGESLVDQLESSTFG